MQLLGSLSNLACVLTVSGGGGAVVGSCLTRLVFSLFQGVCGAVVGSLSNLACVLPVSGGVGCSVGVAVQLGLCSHCFRGWGGRGRGSGGVAV